MVRYVILLQFTEKGITNVKDSPTRAEAFRAAAVRAGVTVEAQYWTEGGYDGVLILTAPDEATAASLVVSLGQHGFVRTHMLRAFQADEFKNILAKAT